MFDLQAGRYNL